MEINNRLKFLIENGIKLKTKYRKEFIEYVLYVLENENVDLKDICDYFMINKKNLERILENSSLE